MDTNVLSYGDNLDILRRYLPDAAVDLVELDPPLTRIATTTSSSATSQGRASGRHEPGGRDDRRRHAPWDLV
jgi:hypothetical protein